MNHSEQYIRVAAGMPRVTLADCNSNVSNILAVFDKAANLYPDVMVFPELSVTGYTCGDLFDQRLLLSSAETALEKLMADTASSDSLIIAGIPVVYDENLYNCAVAIRHGRLFAIIPKTYIPDYNEFYEKRWFAPAPAITGLTLNFAGQKDVPFGTDILLALGDTKIGVEICEDMWSPLSPSVKLALAGADVIVNLSASDSVIGKYQYIKELVSGKSASLICGYVYCSAGFGESTTDMTFESKAIIAENGRILDQLRTWETGGFICSDIDVDILSRDRRHFKTFGDCRRNNTTQPEMFRIIDCGTIAREDKFTSGLLRDIDPRPFVPADDLRRRERCEEILQIQSAALARRLEACHARTAVVGISGGLDSTLALIVTAMAFDRLGRERKDIVGVTMPGFGTTDRTHDNAVTLMKLLGCTVMEIPIASAVRQHFHDIGHNPDIHDVTYENCQARERTQILMDLSNRLDGIVVGTGDMSELALGWATYNGDQMSMYGVNAGVPKTLVRYLVETYARTSSDSHIAAVLDDIIDTPISPELLPASDTGEIKQKTEDLVGPYELHDFFLYHTLRYSEDPLKIFNLAVKAFEGVYDRETIAKWIKVFFRRFFAQQFKRSCMPDGPKVGSVCLSPRGDWRMPSDASSKMWLDRLETIK